MAENKALYLVFSFLLGSIPFAWIVARAYGVKNLSAKGSGNPGATNVTRTAGVSAGILTFVLDFFKGFAPLFFFPSFFQNDPPLLGWIGLVAVFGHCFSPFLKFRGGKGVSTAFGVFCAIHPFIGMAALLIYGVALLASRISAMGSLFAMLFSLIGFSFFNKTPSQNVAVGLIIVLVLVRHRSNWEKLLQLMLVICFLGTATFSSVNASSAPTRIVALMPNLAEAVIDLSQGDKLVGAPSFTQLPGSLSVKVKNLGPYPRISVEAVLALRPDLTLATTDGNDRALVERLRNLGLKVLLFGSSSLAGISEGFDILVRALELPPFERVQEFKRKVVQAPIPSKSKTGFLQVGWEPLVSVGRSTFLNELAQRGGIKNVFGDSDIKYPRPAIEEVLRRNPEVILIFDLERNEKNAKRALTFWKRFPNLKAVRENGIHVLPGDLFAKPGLNLIEALTVLKAI